MDAESREITGLPRRLCLLAMTKESMCFYVDIMLETRREPDWAAVQADSGQVQLLLRSWGLLESAFPAPFEPAQGASDCNKLPYDRLLFAAAFASPQETPSPRYFAVHSATSARASTFSSDDSAMAMTSW